LLCFVPSNRANDSVFLSNEAVSYTVSIGLDLGGVVLGLASSVLLLPRVRPRRGAGHIADGLDDGSLYRMVLTSGLAIKTKQM
jgi:hypothetical protein